MNYDSIQSTYIIKQKIYVNKKTIFIVLPDTNLQIYNEIYNTNFLLSNCSGLICPNKIFTIGRKKFNGKVHFLEVKKRLMANTEEKIGKKIKVLGSLVLDKEEKDIRNQRKSNYYFYDATMWIEAFNYLLQHFSERGATKILLNELESLYKKIKSFNPIYNVDLVFFIKNQQGQLFNTLMNLRNIIKSDDFKKMNFFDDYALVSDCQNVLIPLVYREKGETKIIISNLQKLKTFVEENPEIEQISQSSVVVSDKKEPKPKEESRPISSIISNIVQDLQSSKLIADMPDRETQNIKVSLNQEDLRKILKVYKINDPDIIANVKSALESYINTTKERPTREEAEHVVLKAINYTIYGTGEISEEHLEKPSLLINKLKQIDTYKVPLVLPATQNTPLQLDKIIDLKYTTGQHRQKFEFETVIHENIQKLFGSLETINTECPIKVKKIEHEIKDDNSDRYINYKITLQNLAGGKKEPYVVQLKVPSPINDKYFKLHGNHYIMSTQQFLRPITKTDKNEVRMISNYGIVRVGLANTKFNPSDLDNILEYIKVKYPKLIKEKTEESCQFSDGSIINFAGLKIYESPDLSVTTDEDTGKLINQKTNEPINQGKYEFIYSTILDKIQTINPEDQLTKTKKSNPYIWIYLGAIKMPLILYLWSQQGLLSALNTYGIDYEIVDNNKGSGIFIPTKDNKFLLVKPDNIKEQFIANGLLNIKLKEPVNDLTNPEEIYQYIADNYGSRAMDLITLLTVNFIDPVTKELLQFENLPTNLVSLSSTIAVDQLLNKKIDSLSDLKLYRSRLSEVILHSVYKQIKMAQNTYRKNVLVGDENATVFLDPDYVINTLLTDAGVLQNIEPVSPISEIMQSSRVIKTGIGGIPSRRSSKKEHRNIHPSQYGIISACSTPEYIDVGLTVHHTLTPVIINKYGSYGIKDITNLSGWNILALDESLTPFQNQVDSDRMILARTHSNQVIPISNSEAPLVATGAEAITSQLASPRFVQRAKRDGVITDVVPNKTLTVKYKNGSTEVFDILPRLSRTKRGSYIALEMQTLPINTKVKANQAIAFTKNFDENGIYCAGKNVFIAVMNYLGYSHEDSYVISKDLADETKTDIVSEVSIIIPPNTKIVKLEKEKNKIVENGEILVEFSYEDNLENYIETTELEDDEETSELYSMGDGTIKKPSPVTGEIIDIKVYINNKNSTDRSLISFHSKLVKETAEIVGKLEKSITDPSQKIVSTDNMDLSFVNIGKHKYKGAEFLGARIVYYIKEQKSLLEGDKMSNRYGAKGVISKILNPPPKGEITPRIDVFISPISILGRKNIAMLKELYLGKIFYFANSQLKDLADDPKITNDKIVKFITDLYMIIGPDKIAKSVSENLKQYGNGSQLRKEIKDNKFKLFCLVEPFDDIPFKNIKTAAEFIDIPLEEKVYIPELDQWTDTAVPVGVSYFLFLEHFSEVYANVRGTGKFVSLTRQPTKRKAQGGGQAIGRLDMYSFLTYGANNILTELLGPRSDEHKSKRDLYNTIIETGELPSAVEITKTGGTKDIFNLYITGLGLEIV